MQRSRKQARRSKVLDAMCYAEVVELVDTYV